MPSTRSHQHRSICHLCRWGILFSILTTWKFCRGQGFGGLRKRWADNSTKLERIGGDTDKIHFGDHIAPAERHAIRWHIGSHRRSRHERG